VKALGDTAIVDAEIDVSMIRGEFERHGAIRS
jgi:hypothetical protein